ncbi:methyltransferase domain protein [Clostridiales bacterium KA00134]|nr:methyltransferase domain protein [Clostridiales bacterium KA00134]
MEKNKTSLGHDFLKMLGRTKLRPGGGVITNWLLEKAQIKKDFKVLEVACNQGDNLIRIYTDFACHIQGVDMGQTEIEQCKSNLKALDLDEEIKVEQMDARNLKFLDESFDVIINEAMLTMLSDADKNKALKEYHRVLKKGGLLLTHDVALDEDNTEAKRRVSKMVNASVSPMGAGAWKNLFESNGFEILDMKTGPFLLLDKTTIIKDEGPIRAAAFFKKAMQDEYRQRFLMMKKMQEENMNYIALFARKK